MYTQKFIVLLQVLSSHPLTHVLPASQRKLLRRRSSKRMVVLFQSYSTITRRLQRRDAHLRGGEALTKCCH